MRGFRYLLRQLLWRSVFACTGGLTVQGRPPEGGYVLVANHSSHADAPALLAALPARSRPVVAAAADYWFAGRMRAWFAGTVVGAFGISRERGGCGQLLETVPLLRAGGAVVLFPEGTRTRDGSLGDFRSGAARLAAAAGVPLVPVAMHGTREMLPVHGVFRRRPVTVRIGAPVTDLAEARAVLTRALAEPAPYRAPAG
ncbi:MAG: 1-acyl-sn-glycerol-3-phosphate acyltransferase [Streptosporangiales bacterium]|nr:1-acyl-sn-glycerol-3-phosphate acyltransferase [Streptosporangiales bacterium]